MNALGKFLGRVFDIRGGEWSRLLLLYFFAFMLNVAVVWGKASSEALFLKQVGVELLPLMFVADAILSIITLIIYTAFADRISNIRMMVVILIGGAGVLIAARAGIYLGFNPTFLILYLVARVLQVIIGIHAWTYIADFYDTRTAKRHFPLIASGSRTSGIMAGLLIVPIVTIFSTENLIIAWAVALVGAAGLAWYAPRRTTVVTPEEKMRDDDRGFNENIKEGFGYVSTSSFLRYMAAAAFLSTLLLYLLDFQSQVFFDSHFETADELAQFFGVLGAVADLITLPIQMFLLSRLVTKLGVGNANLVFPSLSALSYALLLNPTLFSASLARIDHTALRSAFRTPLDSLLYNAVPLNVKARARAFNGLLFPVGTLVAGLILIALPIGTLLKAIGMAVAILYLFVSYRLRREYARSLTSLLADDELNIFRMGMGDAELDQPREVTIRLIKERIDQTEEEALTVFLAEMLFDLQGRTAMPYLQDLAAQRGDVVRAGIIELIGNFWESVPAVRQLCVEGLGSDSPLVRKAALNALVGDEPQDHEHDEDLLDRFLAMLDSEDEEVQTTVIPPLIASGDFYYLAPGVQQLSHWLSEEASPQERTRGLRTLARTGSERMIRTMVRYLEDSEPMVRRQAADLIDNLAANTYDPEVRELGLRTLASLLNDEDQAVRLAAVEGLANFQAEDATTALLDALADKSFMVRRRASELISQRVGEDLESSLELDNQYLAESAAFILSSTNHTRARRRALELMDKLVGDTYALVAQRLPLERIDRPGVRLLQATLAEQENLLMERFFWLLSALSSEDEARSVKLALQDADPLKRANAIEALESLTTPTIARRVAPLYERQDLATEVQDLRTSLNLAFITRWQAFFQFWPRLRAATQTDVPSRQLYLPDDDGWLQATAIYAMTEVDIEELHEGVSKSPITKEAIRLAIEASTNDEAPLVRETARIALQHLHAADKGEIEEKLMLSTIEKVIFLKEVPFFEEMTISQLRVLASISEEAYYKEGDIIFEEDEYGDALFVVIDGEVALQKRQQRGMTTSIRRLTTHGKREYFAEMAIFDDKPHQHDAAAIKDSHLLIVRRDTLVALLNHQPDLALTMLRVLSERLRQFTDVIAEKSESKPKQLVDLFDRLG